MGREPEPDRGTALVQDEWFDDNATATTAATTAADSTDLFDSDEDMDDGDDDFAAENRPREPPKELLFGGQGTSVLTRDAQRQTAILGNKSAIQAPLNDEAGGECRNATHADYDIEERGGESRNANHPNDAAEEQCQAAPHGDEQCKTAIPGNKTVHEAPLNDEAGGECRNATHPHDAMSDQSQGMRRPTRPP